MSEPQVQSDQNKLYAECSRWGFTKLGGVSPSHIVPDTNANSEPSCLGVRESRRHKVICLSLLS